MSVIRLLPARFHAVADYAVALLLILVPLVVHGSRPAVATGVVVGVVVAVVSALTRYPLGVVKVLPFTVHSAGDYLAVVLLVAAPFALHFNHTDSGLAVFYAGAGFAVLAVSLITNYQYSPKRAGAPAQQPGAAFQPDAASQPAPAFQQAPTRDTTPVYLSPERQREGQGSFSQERLDENRQAREQVEKAAQRPENACLRMAHADGVAKMQARTEQHDHADDQRTDHGGGSEVTEGKASE